jgi:hypothetical protein
MARTGTAAAYASLREAFSGPAIRALIGLKDMGENFLARVRNADGDSFYDTTGENDVWIHYVDELSGYPGMARLHIPGNVLFALPEENDTCMVVRPAEVNAPGASYLLHGDGGDTQRFPSWIATKVGLFTKKVLRLESKDEAVEVQAGDGKDVVLNGGSAKVTREGDSVNPTADMTTWMNAVSTALTLTAPPGAIGVNSGGASNVKA